MGWIGDRVTATARRIAAAAADVPVRRAIWLHVQEVRDLVAIGVSLGRICEALAQAGVLGPRTRKPISPNLLCQIIASAPEAPAIVPPAATSPAYPPPAPSPVVLPPVSRAGRGLESLVKKRSTT